MRGTAPASPLLHVFILALSVIVACGGEDARAAGECALPESAQASVECRACAESACAPQTKAVCAAECADRATSVACQLAIAEVAACALESCSAECAGFSDGGGTSSGSEPGFSCYVEERGLCSAAAVLDATRETYVRACADVGGVVSEICPTRLLIGCCSYAGGTQTCVYETTAPPLDRDSCGESGGRWGEPE